MKRESTNLPKYSYGGEGGLERKYSAGAQEWPDMLRFLKWTNSMKAKTLRGPQLRPRIRVVCGEEIALGPGKVDLLAVVAETGSIREAAERMGMSYMRAWKLIKTMNACFKKPLVEAVRGGRGHGGASLTKTGLAALELYHGMEGDCVNAAQRRWKRLRSLLRD